MERLDRPLVTVIMPSLNVGDFIRESLESVVGQTLRNLEVLCVDAGSTDGTVEVIEEFASRDPRVRLIRSDQKSYGRQLNLGMDAARGKYLVICETDDAISPLMCARLSSVAEREHADFVKADYWRCTGDLKEGVRERVDCTSNSRLYGRTLNPQRDIRAIQFTIICGNLYRFDFLRRHGIRFNESPGASYQDVGFYLQTHFFATRVHFLNEAFYLYRRDNPNSSINSKAKVFVGCDEFTFAHRRVCCNRESRRRLKRVFGRELFFGYWATLNRIGPEYRGAFVERFSKDLRDTFSRGELDRKLLGQVNWRRALDIMLMPKTFLDMAFPSKEPTPEVPLVVSLTTWPKRIGTVHMVIENMLRQTRRPDKVVLYLAEEEFPDHCLPDALDALVRRDSRVEVRYMENLRSHKKYYRALQDFPHAAVVLVDDDIVYPETMLRELMIWYRRRPHAITCFRAHVVSMDGKGGFAPYVSWMRERKIVNTPSPLVFATTGGGTIIPPGCIPSSAFDAKLIREVALGQDDLWIKWQALMAGVPVVYTKGYGKDSLELIDGTQGEKLCDDNVDGHGNDRAWNRIIEAYPEEKRELAALLSADYAERFKRVDPVCAGWWQSKMAGLNQCILDNGYRYTFFHLFEKVFGKLNEICHKQCVRAQPPAREVQPQDSHAEVDVSVIIPVYNAEQYLRQCLDSVLGQKGINVEAICVDDGSSDASLVMLREYAAKDDRVIVLTQSNATASVARNRSIAIARGEFLAFMDADDFYAREDSLCRLCEVARRERVAVAGGTLERFRAETPDVIEKPRTFAFLKPGRCRYADNPFDFGYQLFIFSRKMVVDNEILFPIVSRYQDPPFMVKVMSTAQDFCFVDYPVYRYRFGHQNINWRKDDYRKARDMFTAMAEVVKVARRENLIPLVETTRRRIERDYKAQLFDKYPEIREFPEFKLLTSLLNQVR